MEKPAYKTLSKEVFFKTPWTTFMHNKFTMPNGKEGNYWYVHTKGSSFVIPVLPNGRIILGHQYRYLTDRLSYEFAGGSVNEDKTYEEAARQELEEELGYTAQKLKEVGEFCPMNGVTDEICKVFVATGIEKTAQNLEETEQIEELTFSPEEFDRMIAEGKMDDGMTLAAWALARPHLGVTCKE